MAGGVPMLLQVREPETASMLTVDESGSTPTSIGRKAPATIRSS